MLTPASDSARSRLGNNASGAVSCGGAFTTELSEPLTLPPIGGGDVVARSLNFSEMPLSVGPPFVKVEAEGVPSDVWMFLVAGGRAATGGAVLFLDLPNPRNDIFVMCRKVDRLQSSASSPFQGFSSFLIVP